MPLESGNYISDLEVTNPPPTDSVSQGQDHIRLIKKVIKATFPNLTGPVTKTQAEINAGLSSDGGIVKDLTVVQATVSATEGGQINLQGAGAHKTTSLDTVSSKFRVFSGLTLDLEVDHNNGNVNASRGKLMEGGAALVPRGVLVMWHGLEADCPAGWAICNGQVVAGYQTPDLRSRFVIGAGAGVPYAPGDTGSSNQKTITSSTNGAHSHAGSTGAAGAHDHGGVTGSTALTEAQMPAHTHTITHGSTSGGGAAGVGGGSAGTTGTYTTTNATGGNLGHDHSIAAVGTHVHSLTTDTEAGHAHTVVVDTRPAFYALCYIVKL